MRHHVVAGLHIDTHLGPALAHLIVRTSGEMHQEVATTHTVIPHGLVEGHKLIVGGIRLTLAHASKGLHTTIRLTIYRGRCPVVAMLGVGQTLTGVGMVGSLHKLAAGILARAPPDAGLQSVLHAHHSLHHVVELIGRGMLTSLTHLGEEVGIIVKTTRQLMGIALLEHILEVGPPLQRLVVVERIAATHAHTVIFIAVVVAQTVDDGFEVCLACRVAVSLVPPEVGLVVGAYAHQVGQTATLVVVVGHIDKFSPTLPATRTAYAALVVPAIHRFVVVVEVVGHIATEPSQRDVGALLEVGLLILAPCAFVHLARGLE